MHFYCYLIFHTIIYILFCSSLTLLWISLSEFRVFFVLMRKMSIDFHWGRDWSLSEVVGWSRLRDSHIRTQFLMHESINSGSKPTKYLAISFLQILTNVCKTESQKYEFNFGSFSNFGLMEDRVAFFQIIVRHFCVGLLCPVGVQRSWTSNAEAVGLGSGLSVLLAPWDRLAWLVVCRLLLFSVTGLWGEQVASSVRSRSVRLCGWFMISKPESIWFVSSGKSDSKKTKNGCKLSAHRGDTVLADHPCKKVGSRSGLFVV